MNSNWKLTKLGRHVDLLTGFPFKSEKFTSDKNDIALVKGENLHQKYIDWENSKRWDINEYESFSKFQLKKDDIVVAMDRPWIEAGLKYSWIKKDDPKSLLVQRVARLRGKNGLETSFLRYIVGGPYFSAYLKNIVTGVNVPHISGKQILDFNFYLPPLPTQKKIASILSAYDDLIENNNQRIKLLEEMAEEIYKEWFVRLRFPGYQDTKFFNQEGEEVKHGTVGALPEGWDVKGVFDLSEVTYGFPFNSSMFTEEKCGLPIIRIRDIKNNFSKTFSPQVADKKYYVEDGDLLVGMDGEFHVGKWAGKRAYLNQRVVRFRPKVGVSKYFIYWAFKEKIDFLNKVISGTTVAHLSDRDLKKLKIVTPPKTLMTAYSQKIDPFFDLEVQLKLKNQILQETRDLLLPRLISGKLNVEELEISEAENILISEL